MAFSTFKNEDVTKGRSGKSSAEKLAELRGLMKSINRSNGNETLSMVDADYEVARISSGILPLDLILGGSIKTGFGWPKGKIIELFGPEHAGKTSICNAAIAEVQRNGGTVLYVAGEDGMDPVYAKKFGVRIEDVIFLHPLNAEQGFDTTLSLVESGLIDLVVIDSIVSMIPMVVMDGDMEKREMGNLARLIQLFVSKAQPAIQKNGCTIIATNQLRDNITSYGGGTRTAGGRGLKHYAGVRLELKNPGKERYIDPETKEEAGIYVTCYTKKNRHNKPFQTAMFPLLFDKAIDNEANLFLAAKDMGVLGKKGAYYMFDGEQFQGQTKFIKALKENQDFFSKLDLAVKEAIANADVIQADDTEDEEDSDNG